MLPDRPPPAEDVAVVLGVGEAAVGGLERPRPGLGLAEVVAELGAVYLPERRTPNGGTPSPPAIF